MAPKEHRTDTPAGAESPASGFSLWSPSERCRGEAPLCPLTPSPWAQSPLTLLRTTQHPCREARGAHLPEAHLCLEPEQGQNQDQGDFRASCLPFPMPVPPWLQPASHPSQPLPPGFPRAARGHFRGPRSSASVALPFQPLLWPCCPHRAGMEVSGHRRAGSWSRTQAFKCPSWVRGQQLVREGADKRITGARRQEEGWGLSRPTGLERGLLAGSGLYRPEGCGAVGRAEHHGTWDSRSSFAVLSPGHAVGGGEAPGPCPPWAAGARGKRSQ